MGRGNDPDDNVVRFPRDWIGPREDLIPFGPSADTEGPEGDEQPRSAEDFWGEGSSSVHDALCAPGAQSPLADEPAPWFGARDRPARAPGLTSRLGGRRVKPTLAASMAAVSVLVAALLLIDTGPRSSPARRAAHQAAQLPSQNAVRTGPALTAEPGTRLRGHSQPTRRRLHAAPRARVHRERSSAHRSARAAQPTTRTATAQPVRYTPLPSSSSSSSSSGTTGTGAPAGASSTSAASPPATTAGTGASSGSQPAFGAGGTLGPGSSPDS